MPSSFQVWLLLGLTVICGAVPGPVTTTPSSQQTAAVTANKDASTSKQAEDFGISHVIKHSKLFTEFVSFAVNPVKSMELVDGVKSKILLNQTASSSDLIRESEANGTGSLSDGVQSNAVLQQLFQEMTKVGSPGFIVSFDYLNITAKSSAGESTLRKPVRMWGILPDELNNKTLYFLADYYQSTSYSADTMNSAKEQIQDFESWKNETLASGEFTGDKLGDGTIGSLLG